jgi:hypothetical protein
MDDLTRGDVCVSWVELGEGYNGDYDEEDPEDVELLRFDVLVRGPLIELHGLESERAYGEWANARDSSYCTLFPVESTPEQRERGLHIIMDRIYAPLMMGLSIKKVCQELSWIEPAWIKEEAKWCMS